ncbi:MAG: PqqD family protein, partial [Alphaproteobacteria bacterium]|nr:PqqD family protein [Alphaproteobacteria bacterium]
VAKGVAIEKIAAALKAIAGAPQDMEARLSAFVGQLKEKEIVIESADSGEAVNIDENVAKEDEFVLLVDEYNDAQEMLLADPIHEVKEETGWTPEKSSIGYTKEETKEREKKLKE